MRYGVIADVHANLHALDAAIDVLRGARVDRYLCLGDLVGYGAFPNECVRRVHDLRAVCVAGNHDLIATGQLGEGGVGMLARETLRWTREALDDDVRRRLQQLPLVAVPDPRIVLAHGSLGDPRRYVVDVPEAAEQLGLLAANHERARLLLLGHTHVRRAYGETRGDMSTRRRRAVLLPRGERMLLNPGSVGQSRRASPHGEVLVVDTERWTACFHVVRYDRAAARRALDAKGLPIDAYHRKPYAPRPVAARARRLLRAP